MRYEVLDLGFVMLQGVLGDDLSVVNAARVSFQNQRKELGPKDIRLIEYLARNNHFTPFAQPQVRFHIKMPIFVARQWYKHTIGLTRNEVSRRYVSSTPDFHLPFELRLAAANVKQGSTQEAHHESPELLAVMRESFNVALVTYNRLISEGVCAEQARIVLPQAMYTEFIETGSLAAYARIFSLRAEKTAQYEIQQYALAIGACMQEMFPYSWKALTNVERIQESNSLNNSNESNGDSSKHQELEKASEVPEGCS